MFCALIPECYFCLVVESLSITVDWVRRGHREPQAKPALQLHRADLWRDPPPRQLHRPLPRRDLVRLSGLHRPRPRCEWLARLHRPRWLESTCIYARRLAARRRRDPPRTPHPRVPHPGRVTSCTRSQPVITFTTENECAPPRAARDESLRPTACGGVLLPHTLWH